MTFLKHKHNFDTHNDARKPRGHRRKPDRVKIGIRIGIIMVTNTMGVMLSAKNYEQRELESEMIGKKKN